MPKDTLLKYLELILMQEVYSCYSYNKTLVYQKKMLQKGGKLWFIPALTIDNKCVSICSQLYVLI